MSTDFSVFASPQTNPMRTRIAPTPSGFLHEGNLINFTFTSRLTQYFKGELGLRIDDLDQARFRNVYLKDIFTRIEELGIPIAFGPSSAAEHIGSFSQTIRINNYHNLLDSLIETGQVFACSCSRKEIQARVVNGMYDGKCRKADLPLNAPDTCLRLKIDENTFVRMHLLNGEARELKVSEFRKDPVIRRRDGLPSYDVASLFDDVNSNISCLVRGADLFESSVLQLHMANVLNLSDFSNCSFVHHDLVLDDDGNKLSKSTASGIRPAVDLQRVTEKAQELFNAL